MYEIGERRTSENQTLFDVFDSDAVDGAPVAIFRHRVDAELFVQAKKMKADGFHFEQNGEHGWMFAPRTEFCIVKE